MAQYSERYVQNSDGIEWFCISDDEKYIAFRIDRKICIWNTETNQKIWTISHQYDRGEYIFVNDYMISASQILNLNKLFRGEDDFMFIIPDVGNDKMLDSNVIINKDTRTVYIINARYDDFTCYTFDGNFVNRFRVPDKSGRLKYIQQDINLEDVENFDPIIQDALENRELEPRLNSPGNYNKSVWWCTCIDNCLYIQFYIHDNREIYYPLYYNTSDFIKVNLQTGVITKSNLVITQLYKIFPNKMMINFEAGLKNMISFENENDIHTLYTFEFMQHVGYIDLTPSHKYFILKNKLMDAETGANFLEFGNDVKTIIGDKDNVKIFLIKENDGVKRLFIYYLEHVSDNPNIISAIEQGMQIEDIQNLIMQYMPELKELVLPIPFREVEIRTVQLEPVELLDIYEVGDEDEEGLLELDEGELDW